MWGLAPPAMTMELQHGTEQEHLASLERAKQAGLSSIWSGDVRRNAYLRENMVFAEKRGIAKFTFYEDYYGQESGWNVEWLS